MIDRDEATFTPIVMYCPRCDMTYETRTVRYLNSCIQCDSDEVQAVSPSVRKGGGN